VASPLEIAVNGANVAISLLIFGFVIVLGNFVRTLGKDVAIAALYLKERESVRGVSALFAGIVVFLISNLLELYGDLQSIDWTLNEIVETMALALILLGVLRFFALLRRPAALNVGRR